MVGWVSGLLSETVIRDVAIVGCVWGRCSDWCRKIGVWFGGFLGILRRGYVVERLVSAAIQEYGESFDQVFLIQGDVFDFLDRHGGGGAALGCRMLVEPSDPLLIWVLNVEQVEALLVVVVQ